MTKSIIITYNEADEGFLMTLFKKFKIKTQPATELSDTLLDDDNVPTKAEFLDNLKASVAEMHAHQRGEIELQDIDALLAELAGESTGV